MALADFIFLLPSLITALATSISAFLLLRATKPFISIRFEPDKYDNLTRNLVIENLGHSSAKDVKFKITPDFENIEGKFLSEIGLFKNGLPIFTPNHKIMIYLTWMPADYERKIKMPFAIEVCYKHFLLKYKQKYEIDLSLYGEMPLTANPLKKIAESLEKIGSELHSIGGSSGKIHVVRQTEIEYRNELQREYEEMKKRETENK